jgi:hypothetical protein
MMETTRSVVAAILPGDSAVSLDYGTRIQITCIFFYFEGRVYQFKAMPFVLASAPLIFQSIVKAFVALLYTLGLRLHLYLDDWLLRNAMV